MYFYVYEIDPAIGEEIWRSTLRHDTYRTAKEECDQSAKNFPSRIFEVNHEWIDD